MYFVCIVLCIHCLLYPVSTGVCMKKKNTQHTCSYMYVVCCEHKRDSKHCKQCIQCKRLKIGVVNLRIEKGVENGERSEGGEQCASAGEGVDS